jgi:hypothetical protein
MAEPEALAGLGINAMVNKPVWEIWPTESRLATVVEVEGGRQRDLHLRGKIELLLLGIPT